MKRLPASESADTQPACDDTRRQQVALRTSWFDAVTSFLTALILLLGTCVLLLAVVWWSSDRQTMVGPAPPPISRLGTAGPKGLERDFVEPGAEEIVELDEPTVRDSLLAVTDAVRRVAGSVPLGLASLPGKQREVIQFDRQLLQRAGAQVEGREMLKFVPVELENQLAKIELEYAMSNGHGSVDSIARTVFTSKSAGDGHQFVVTGQRYRRQKD